MTIRSDDDNEGDGLRFLYHRYPSSMEEPVRKLQTITGTPSRQTSYNYSTPTPLWRQSVTTGILFGATILAIILIHFRVPILDWLRFQYDRIERFLHRLYLSNYLSNDRIATTRMATINQQQQQHRVTHRNRQRSRTHSMPDLVPLLLSSTCTTTTMSGVGPSNNELQEQSSTTTLEPAFEQDSMYPLGWLVYHPIVGVITKTEADALEQQVCCKEQEATKDNSYDEDLAIDTIKRTSSLKVETKEIESDSTSS